MPTAKKILNSQLPYALLGVIESLLLGRFILKLFGVESTNFLAGTIYTLTGWLVAPAKRLLGIGETLPGAVWETQTVVTVVVVAIVGVLLAALLKFLKSTRKSGEEGEVGHA